MYCFETADYNLIGNIEENVIEPGETRQLKVLHAKLSDRVAAVATLFFRQCIDGIFPLERHPGKLRRVWGVPSLLFLFCGLLVPVAAGAQTCTLPAAFKVDPRQQLVVFDVGARAAGRGGNNIVVEAQANSSTGGQGKDTGIDIQKGAALHITATGTWSAGSDEPYSRKSDAGGITAHYGKWRQEGLEAPYGALVGKIGDGPYFLVGRNYASTAGTSGRLKLYYWDSNNGDNSGQVRVVVSGTFRAPTASVTLTVSPEVVAPQDTTNPWHILLQIKKIDSRLERLDAATRKRAEEELDQFKQRLKKFGHEALKKSEKETLQKTGLLRFSIAPAAEGFTTLKLRARTASLVAITTPHQTDDLYTVAKEQTKLLQRFFKLKSARDRVERNYDNLVKQVAKLDEPLDALDDTLNALRRYNVQQGEIETATRQIEELTTKTLPPLQEKADNLAADERKPVIFVNWRAYLKMVRGGKKIDGSKVKSDSPISTHFKTLKVAKIEAAEARKQQYTMLYTALEEASKAGHRQDLKTTADIAKAVEESHTYKPYLATQKWLDDLDKGQTKALTDASAKTRAARDAVRKVEGKIRALEKKRAKLNDDYAAAQRDGKMSGLYNEAKRLIGTSRGAPSADAFHPVRGNADAGRRVVDWIRQQRAAKKTKATELSKKGLEMLPRLGQLDAETAQFWRTVTHQRIITAYRVCVALGKQQLPTYKKLAKELDDYLKTTQLFSAFFGDLERGDLEKWAGRAKSKADYLEAPLKAIRLMLERAGESTKTKLDTIGTLAKNVKDWTTRTKAITELMDTYERDDPQFLSKALSLSKEMTGLAKSGLPMRASLLSAYFEVLAKSAEASIKAGISIATKNQERVWKAVRPRPRATPERVLMSRKAINADRYYKYYSDLTGKDLDQIATYFQARRILFLLKVKSYGELVEIR